MPLILILISWLQLVVLYIHNLISVVFSMQAHTTVDDVRENISELKEDVKQEMMVGIGSPHLSNTSVVSEHTSKTKLEVCSTYILRHCYAS